MCIKEKTNKRRCYNTVNNMENRGEELLFSLSFIMQEKMSS